MALYIPHSIFHLARLLYVRPETFGPYYVYDTKILRACMDWIQYYSVTSVRVHKRRGIFFTIYIPIWRPFQRVPRSAYPGVRGETYCGLKLAIYP